MNNDEYTKDLKRDRQLRKAVAVINKHYGAPRPIWRRAAPWAAAAALVLLAIGIAAWNS